VQFTGTAWRVTFTFFCGLQFDFAFHTIWNFMERSLYQYSSQHRTMTDYRQHVYSSSSTSDCILLRRAMRSSASLARIPVSMTLMYTLQEANMSERVVVSHGTTSYQFHLNIYSQYLLINVCNSHNPENCPGFDSRWRWFLKLSTIQELRQAQSATDW
jgi:hypothetical protein